MIEIDSCYTGIIGKIGDFDTGFCFTRDNLPLESNQFSANKISVRRGVHPYEQSILLDMLLFFSHKKSYQHLGLCLFSFILSKSKKNLEIYLSDSESEIKLLKVINPIEKNDDEFSELSISIDRFNYFPQKIMESIIHGEKDDRFLPKMKLTDEMGRGIIEGGNNRDIAILDCHFYGLINIACLLLDFGQQSNEISELVLEGYPGSQAVAKTSAEIILNLPDSDWAQ